MQDETIRSKQVEVDGALRAVLGMLLSPDQQRPWSVGEVEREIGSQVAAADALSTLHAAGLIHRCGEFVFASRAAVRADELSG
jgi:hypothetical protein